MPNATLFRETRFGCACLRPWPGERASPRLIRQSPRSHLFSFTNVSHKFSHASRLRPSNAYSSSEGEGAKWSNPAEVIKREQSLQSNRLVYSCVYEYGLTPGSPVASAWNPALPVVE